VKPYLLVLFLLLLVTGAFAASAQPAQLVALACFGVAQFQNCPSGGRPDNVIRASYGVSEVTQEGESNPQGGLSSKSRPAGSSAHFSCRHEQQLSQRQPARLFGGRFRRKFVWH